MRKTKFFVILGRYARRDGKFNDPIVIKSIDQKKDCILIVGVTSCDLLANEPIRLDQIDNLRAGHLPDRFRASFSSHLGDLRFPDSPSADTFIQQIISRQAAKS